jgi:hypothetical protein
MTTVTRTEGRGFVVNVPSPCEEILELLKELVDLRPPNLMLWFATNPTR